MERRTWAVVLALVLIALCLRGAITGVGPMTSIIGPDLGLSNGMTGSLTAIPLLAFGFVSLVVGGLGRRFGAGRLMLFGLVLALAGLLCRSYLGVAGLFTGTVVVGVGLTIGNVLVPAFIKKFFPDRIWLMTSVYTVCLTGGAGIAGGISVPIAHVLGWRAALAVWAVLVLVALLWWLPYRGSVLSYGESGADAPGRSRPSMFTSPAAWVVALYMGVQSLLFYCFVAWFVPMLEAQGVAVSTASLYNFVYITIGVLGGLAVPVLARRFSNRVAVGLTLSIVYIVGMACVFWLGNPVCLWAVIVLCGLCQGACISYATAQFGVHTSNPEDASALSGFAQGVGYLIAAVGPILLGAIVDATGSWAAPMVILLVMALVLAVLSVFVGRESVIGQER